MRRALNAFGLAALASLFVGCTIGKPPRKVEDLGLPEEPANRVLPARPPLSNPPPWENVTNQATVGPVRVTLTKAERIDIPARWKAVVVVDVEVENTSSSPVQYSGWSTRPWPDCHACLLDERGTPAYAWVVTGHNPMYHRQLLNVTIRPGEKVTDYLVFDPPSNGTMLHLELPGKAVGAATGARVKIQLP